MFPSSEVSVGSSLLLSLIDMTMVFIVLAFLMGIIYLTYFLVRPRKKKPRDSGEIDCKPDSSEQTPPDAPPVDEMEMVAVQTAALAAYQEDSAQYSTKPSAAQSDNLWRRTWFWSSTQPRSR